MVIKIIYGTISGHSRKIAKAIAEALGTTYEDFRDNPVLTGADLLFVIGGVYASKYNEKLLKFMEEADLSQVKKVALIRSAVSQSALLQENPLREILKKKQIQVEKEEFTFRGNFLFFGCGHPNKAEIAGAVAFAKKVAQA
jgi:flavodoxin